MHVKKSCTVLPTVTVLCFTSLAHALPDPKQSAPVVAAMSHESADNPDLSGAMFFKDADTNVVYVSPGARKVETGTFSPTADADRCEALESFYKFTYAMPDVPASEYAKIAKEQHYSAFFDYYVGDYIRNADILSALADAKNRELNFQNKHGDLFTAYTIAKDFFDEKEGDVIRVQGQIDALQSAITSAITMLSNDGSQGSRDALNAAKDHYSAESPALRTAMHDALIAREKARGPYMNAKTAWGPYMVEHIDVKKTLADLNDVVAAIEENARVKFSLQEEGLLREEARPVGTVSFTYSLFDKEVSAARGLKSSEGFLVNPLPVYNVSVAPVTDRRTGNLDVHLMDKSALWIFPKKEVQNLPIFIDRTGHYLPRPVAMASTDPGNLQTLRTTVTRGAYCMGARPKASPVDVVTSDGLRQTVDIYKYKARTSPMFADSIGFDYAYAVKAEPTSVKCELKIQSIQDFERSSGSINALFYHNSWDDSTRKAVNEQLVKCVVVSLDPGDGSDGRKEQMNRMAQSYSQDVIAEFILTYAKGWTLATDQDRTISTEERAHALANLGANMRMLCGENPYCRIASVSLKTLDEIFNSQSGSTSHHENFQGLITRDYSLTTWSEQYGHAAVELQVKAAR